LLSVDIRKCYVVKEKQLKMPLNMIQTDLKEPKCQTGDAGNGIQELEDTSIRFVQAQHE